MEASEKLVLQHLKEGNEAAFDSLFQKYYSQMVVFSRKYVTDLDIARDIAQDVFVKLFENISNIHIETSIKSYLFQSTRNASLNYLQQSKIHLKHHEIIKEEKKDDIFDDSNWAEETELEHKIFNAINKLPNQCQRIFKMSRSDGKRNQEIAEELKISRRTVETQISKALKFLRNELSEYISILIIIILVFFSNFF